MNWHYTIGGQTYGPITEGELDGLVQAGTIATDTLVWRDGMANWEPYNSVKPSANPAPGGLRVASSAPQSSQEAAAAAQAEGVCSECGTVLPRSNLVQIGSNLICAQCKPRYVQKLREGVDAGTGDGLTYAGFWIRLVAHFVDVIIMYAVNSVIGLVSGMGFGMTRQPQNVSLGIIMVVGGLSLAIPIAYDVIMVGTWGATLGKMACGLRIVTAEGYKISYLHALGRYFAKILSALTCLIGFIMAGFDDQKRALHDRICNTRVVRR